MTEKKNDSTPAAAPASRPKLEVLDALRGFCALLVVILHFSENYIPHFGFRLMPHGCLPVEYFFILTGFTLVNFKTGEMEFKEGAVMAQVVLADEINRTSPKTQSALLEVMEEQQVTVDGVTHPLPKPFMVLATQNPGEFVGTYPLPEAQMDRFFMRISIGYPTCEEEVGILERTTTNVRPMDELRPICAAQDIVYMQEQVGTVYTSKEIKTYVAMIAQASRKHSALQLGVSTRGAIYLLRAAQAYALLNGRDFVTPEDVQKMAEPVLAHRLVLSPEARMRNMTAERVLASVIGSVQVPVKLP